MENTKVMNLDWVKIFHQTKCLPPFSFTDFLIKITPETNEEGFYYTILRFFLYVSITHLLMNFFSVFI